LLKLENTSVCKSFNKLKRNIENYYILIMKELLKILNIKQILPPRKSNPERLRVMQIASLPCTAVHTQKGLPCIHKHAFRMQTASKAPLKRRWFVSKKLNEMAPLILPGINHRTRRENQRAAAFCSRQQ